MIRHRFRRHSALAEAGENFRHVLTLDVAASSSAGSVVAQVSQPAPELVPRQSRASERRADWKTCATADFATALNACVIRFFNEQKQALGYLVLVTTDLNLNAAWIGKHYQQRPEVEQDDEQLKRGGWWLAKLSSTRYNGG